MSVSNLANYYFGASGVTALYIGGTKVWPSSTSYTNYITYTSTDGNVITPTNTTGWSANIVSNTYSGDSGTIVFDRPITSIPLDAFSGSTTLYSMSLPNTVNQIGQSAFKDCTSLSGVTYQDSSYHTCSLGGAAFSGCSSLVSISMRVIPTNYYTFAGCSSLQRISISDSVTMIGNGTFSGCTSLNSVVLPSGTTHIQYSAFRGCTSLTSIALPSTVTYVQEYAFADCTNLYRIYAHPTTAPTINSNTFTDVKYGGFLYAPADSDYSSWLSNDYCYLGYRHWTRLTLNNVITYTTYDNKPYNVSGSPLSAVSTISVYNDYTGIGKIYLDANVTSLPDESFSSPFVSDNVRTVEIPSIITDIGNYTFAACHYLESVSLPNTLTGIGEECFNYCYSLSSLTIPSSVTYIDPTGIQNCANLERINAYPMTAPNGYLGGGYKAGCTLHIRSGATGYDNFIRYTSLTIVQDL